MEIEIGRTTSHSAENSLWKSLRTNRKTDRTCWWCWWSRNKEHTTWSNCAQRGI